MAFWSFGSELDTVPLIEALHARGVRVALPRIVEGDLEPRAYRAGRRRRPRRRSARWSLRTGDALDPARRSTWSRRRPSRSIGAAPRVGYGGGFYDRFFTRTRPDAARVGIGFDVQLVAGGRWLPGGHFDLPVDAVVTESETRPMRVATDEGRRPARGDPRGVVARGRVRGAGLRDDGAGLRAATPSSRSASIPVLGRPGRAARGDPSTGGARRSRPRLVRRRSTSCVRRTWRTRRRSTRRARVLRRGDRRAATCWCGSPTSRCTSWRRSSGDRRARGGGARSTSATWRSRPRASLASAAREPGYPLTGAAGAVRGAGRRSARGASTTRWSPPSCSWCLATTADLAGARSRPSGTLVRVGRPGSRLGRVEQPFNLAV